MKKIIIFIFGRKSKIIKFLAVLKNIFFALKNTLPLLRSNKLKFILKIIKGQIYFEFQPNLDNEKNYFKNKYHVTFKSGTIDKNKVYYITHPQKKIIRTIKNFLKTS